MFRRSSATCAVGCWPTRGIVKQNLGFFVLSRLGWRNHRTAPRRQDHSFQGGSETERRFETQRIEYDLPPDLNERAGNEALQSIKAGLKQRMNPHSYDTWISPLQAAGISGSTLFVKLPIAEFLHVRDKYAKEFSEVCGELKIEFLVPREVAVVPLDGQYQSLKDNGSASC